MPYSLIINNIICLSLVMLNTQTSMPACPRACVRFPVRANVETPKQTARSQSPQLTITRASCYRFKTSDCSVTKKKNTVLQSSVWWQGRPHWSGLVNFKCPITVQTPFKVKSFKNSHPQTLQITYNWHKLIYWTCRSSCFSSLSAQKSRC